MDKTNKNFRVAESCASCKHFYSMLASTGGKKKNGYCILDATGPIPGLGGVWDYMAEYWHKPFSFEEFLEKDKRECRWMNEEQKKTRYNDIVAIVEYWKENKDRIHTTNQANLCDGYVQGRRAGSARGHLKREGIDWILRLDNQTK